MEEVLGEYPQLTREDLLAAIAYGAEMSRELPASSGDKVLHDSARLRVSRLACPSRASWPVNEFTAVDVQLATGTVVSLKKGAAARYNEAPLPLELVRVEVKPVPE